MTPSLIIILSAEEISYTISEIFLPMAVKSGIYIMTNLAFPELVKIGYADNIDERLKRFNSSEALPYPFRLYAYYEVSGRLKDLKIHDVIDKLNPDLRTRDIVNNRKRVREFFIMSAEDAYSMFEAIAQINGLEKNLHLCKQTEADKKEEKEVNEIRTNYEKRSHFNFFKCGIKAGSILHYIYDNSITCEVVDERHVLYNGEITSLSSLTNLIKGGKGRNNGALYFVYNGKTIDAIRREKES